MRIRSVCALIPVAVAVTAVGARAQVSWQRGDQGWCDREWGDGDRQRFCEVLTSTFASPGHLEIDGGNNGSVSVEGWSGSQAEVEARVWSDARTEARAEEIAAQVVVRVEGGRILARGPRTARRESWGVSYRVRVPRSTDLDITTHNGGVEVADVSGDISFRALNGGVRLTGLGGDVHGRTTNGGVHVELSGQAWSGRGLDVETTNGQVSLSVPEDYDAELVTGTVNGGIDIDFPVMVRGRIGRRLETTLGDGGATIRAVTTNGGVRITRGSRD